MTLCHILAERRGWVNIIIIRRIIIRRRRRRKRRRKRRRRRRRRTTTTTTTTTKGRIGIINTGWNDKIVATEKMA